MRTMVAVAFLFLLFIVQDACGHGMVTTPRSRNWVAHQDGINYGAQVGVPFRDFDEMSLNRNLGVCGRNEFADYDEWIDSTGAPMTWTSQAVYVEAETISIEFSLTAFHHGHVEFKACSAGRNSSQSCFDQHPLLFVQDLSSDNMPSDPSYPERGYVGPTKETYQMSFSLPDGLWGDQVLIQWNYITGNSCNPAGYDAYFNGDNSQQRVMTQYWQPTVGSCVFPYSPTGYDEVAPEQFWNCMEVSVTASADPRSQPVTSPISSADEPSLAPSFPEVAADDGCCSQDAKNCVTWCGETLASCEACSSGSTTYFWIDPEQSDCQALWTGCNRAEEDTNLQGDCCPGLHCLGTQWWKQCSVPEPIGHQHQPPEGSPTASSAEPSASPIVAPSVEPSTSSATPTASSAEPSSSPVEAPSVEPSTSSATPTASSAEPSASAVEAPSVQPTGSSAEPSASSVAAPSVEPSSGPTTSSSSEPSVTSSTPPSSFEELSLAPSGTATDDGCCSQDAKTCITWCGDTYASCESCSTSVTYFWIDPASVTDCQALWIRCDRAEDDDDLQGDCCPGLHCLGNQWWKQCAIP